METTTKMIRINSESHIKLKKLSKESGTSMQFLVNTWIDTALKSNSKIILVNTWVDTDLMSNSKIKRNG